MMRDLKPLILLVVMFAFGCKQTGRNVATKAGRIVQAQASAREKPGKTVKRPKKVFVATHAGTWYPGTKKELTTMLQGFFQNANPRVKAKGRLIALIEPHAGYRFSGQTAAYGYKLLKQVGSNVRVVVVMGPSHHVPFHGLALPSWDAFQTPLGTVDVDRKILKNLLKKQPFIQKDDAFSKEHSVEMQIPMLQYALHGFRLVPIVVGNLNMKELQEAASALGKLARRKDVLFVASSDFTHFGPGYGYRPFTQNIPENLKKLADQAIAAIKGLNLRAFIDHRRSTGDTICGFFPISVLLGFMHKGTDVEVLHFDTSGNIMHDYTNSVSYVSIAFFDRTGGDMIQQVNFINKNDEIGLLKLARATLQHHLSGKALPDPKDKAFGLSAKVFEKHGVFVTLNENNNLRGCIGTIMPYYPLAEGVVRNTVNAAAHDPRFRPVAQSEEPAITIEISVLTVPKKVKSYKDVVIGRDGVIIRKNGHSAVYLPQVAPEQKWNIQQTLDHLCMKAGLPPSAWKEPGMEFLTFQAQVFSEEGLGLLK